MPVLPQGEVVGEISTLYTPGIVDPPTIGGPAPYGLMSVAQMINGGANQPRWHSGVQFQPNACQRAMSTIMQCPFPDEFDYTKAVTSQGLPSRGAETFAVYADIECSSVGSWEYAVERALAALAQGEARAVERAFWTGEIDTPAGRFIHPYLASDINLTDPTGEIVLQTAADVLVTGVDIVEGMGILEGALGHCYPGAGVIHAERAVIEHMAAHHMLVRNGQQLFTHAGIPLAFGAGYTGTYPNSTAAPAGTTWIFGTGTVMIRRDPEITITSDRTAALDRSTNTLRLIAERNYNIAWDCCHFAINVSLGGIITGTPGSAT